MDTKYLKKIKSSERKVGREASRILLNQLMQETTPLNKKGSLKESLKVSGKYGRIRLFKLRIKMEKYGYYLQNGINTSRVPHIRTHHKSRKFFSVKEHTVRLNSIPFIDNAVQNSKVIETLTEGLGEIRLQEFEIQFNELKKETHE